MQSVSSIGRILSIRTVAFFLGIAATVAAGKTRRLNRYLYAFLEYKMKFDETKLVACAASEENDNVSWQQGLLCASAVLGVVVVFFLVMVFLVNGLFAITLVVAPTQDLFLPVLIILLYLFFCR